MTISRSYPQRVRDELGTFIRRQKAFLLTLDEADPKVSTEIVAVLDSLTLKELREEKARLAQEYKNRGL